jgi:hypothetical protein
MATSAATAAAAVAARAQREVREHFEKQNAFDAEHAVPYDAPDRMHERQRDLLIGRGILRETGDGRYWIDRDAMRLDEERRRAAAMLVLKIIVIGIVIAIAVAAILAR